MSRDLALAQRFATPGREWCKARTLARGRPRRRRRRAASCHADPPGRNDTGSVGYTSRLLKKPPAPRAPLPEGRAPDLSTLLAAPGDRAILVLLGLAVERRAAAPAR